MQKLWVREREKWRARKRCVRKNCSACVTFWTLFGALAGNRSGNTYFAMNHRWASLHRKSRVRLVAQKR